MQAGKRAMAHLRAICKGILFLGMGVQIGLGIIWMCCNFGRIQDFEESGSVVYRGISRLFGKCPCVVCSSAYNGVWSRILFSVSFGKISDSSERGRGESKRSRRPAASAGAKRLCDRGKSGAFDRSLFHAVSSGGSALFLSGFSLFAGSFFFPEIFGSAGTCLSENRANA